MKKVLLMMVVALVTVFQMGCIPVIKNSMAVQVIPTEKKVENSVVLEKISTILINEGYDIEFVNENLGLIKTGWKDITKAESGASQIIDGLDVMTGGSKTQNMWYLQIQIKINENDYVLKPKYKMITIEKTLFSEKRNEQEGAFDYERSKEREAIERIMMEINKSINLENDYSWKVVENEK